MYNKTPEENYTRLTKSLNQIFSNHLLDHVYQQHNNNQTNNDEEFNPKEICHRK